MPLKVVGDLRANMHDSVVHQRPCMRWLPALGLLAASVEVDVFRVDGSEGRVLVVERFHRDAVEPDRTWPR